MPLPDRLSVSGGFPDWVSEGRFQPFHRLDTLETQGQGLFMIWQGTRLLFPEGDQPAPFEAPPTPLPELRRCLVGVLDGRPCHAIEVPETVTPPPGYAWHGLRSLFPRLEVGMIALAGRSFQLLEWERTHQFCGRCGQSMRNRDHERSRQCTACGYVAYPRISPVVMGLVVRGRELLLARSPHFAPGMYSAVAGFVETGEALEHALAREILEETGIRAGGFRYFDSQPWPFPHSLMVAFTAEYLSGTPVPQPGEIEDVRWFPVDALPPLPPTVSIAGRLIRAVAGQLVHD